MDTTGIFFDFGALYNGSQVAVFVGLAHASCYAAVIGHGVAQLVAHHAVVANICIPGIAQIVVDCPEGGLSVVVVGVDHGKGRAVNSFLGAEDCMTGAPGLCAAFGDRKAFRNFFQLLIGVPDLHGAALQPCAHCFHKILADCFFNYNDCGVEAGFMGIKQGVVQNGFPVAAHRIDLLQTAVTAAHACGHDYQNGFFPHSKYLLGYCDNFIIMIPYKKARCKNPIK